jgi:NAD(P)-dependent dehydrogenase (short-subunit alcohol dehydrogenase family)
MTSGVAVVTGVSKGLGASLAAALADRSFEVIGLGRSAAKGLEPPRCRLVAADLADVRALAPIVETLFADLAARQPGTIVVINNAAVAGPTGTVGALDAGEVGQSLAVNLLAPAIVADAFVRAFAPHGGDRRLINVSSGAAVRPLPGGGVYCVAKAGLEMLTQVVAAEQGPHGIRAITIRPGIIDTPMQAFLRSQSPERLPSLDLFRGFHAGGQLQSADATAAKIVDRLVFSPVDNGRVYSYAEL